MRISSNLFNSLQQTGAARDSTALAVRFHDIRRPLGEGCEAWAVSRSRLASLVESGLPSAVVDRLRRLILVVDAAGGEIISVMKGDLSRLQRRERRRLSRRLRPQRAIYDHYPSLVTPAR